MACLGSIPAPVFGCGRVKDQSSMARLVEIIIIPTNIIQSASSGIPTLKPDSKGQVISGVNNSIKVNIEMVKNEGGRDSVKVSFEITEPSAYTLDNGLALSGMGLDCIIAFKTATGNHWCVGAPGSLETLAVSQSSTDHGYRVLTIGTPDWKFGSTVVGITAVVYNSLK